MAAGDKIYVAKEDSVQEINGKVGAANNTGGSATAGTVMGKLNKLLTDWTSARAGKIDTIDTNAAAAKNNASTANVTAEAARVAAVRASQNTDANNTANATGALSQKLTWLINNWTAARAAKIDTIATDATAAKNNAANAATKAEQARVAAVAAQNNTAGVNKGCYPSSTLQHTLLSSEVSAQTQNQYFMKVGAFIPKATGVIKIQANVKSDVGSAIAVSVAMTKKNEFLPAYSIFDKRPNLYLDANGTVFTFGSDLNYCTIYGDSKKASNYTIVELYTYVESGVPCVVGVDAYGNSGVMRCNSCKVYYSLA